MFINDACITNQSKGVVHITYVEERHDLVGAHFLLQKGWLRITDDFVAMPNEAAQPGSSTGQWCRGVKQRRKWAGLEMEGGSVSLTKSTSTEHRETFLPTECKSEAS